MTELDPPTLSAEQRISRKLAAFKARLHTLEMTRPVTAFSDGPPTTDAPPGTRYFDRLARKLYVYSDAGWFAPEARHAESFISTTISTSNGTPTDFGGPSLTIFLPEPAVVNLQIDCEMNFNVLGNGGRCSLDTPLLGTPISAIEGEMTPLGAQTQKTGGNWYRYLSQPRNIRYAGGDIGADYPYGGFMTEKLDQGTYTFTVLYSTLDSYTVQFRNRRIWALVF